MSNDMAACRHWSGRALCATVVLLLVGSASSCEECAAVAAASVQPRAANTPLPWSDPATWNGNSLPNAGDLVTIPVGSHLILDQTPPALAGLLVKGRLTVKDGSDLGLTTGYLLVMGNGAHFGVGTAERPFLARFTLTLTGEDRNLSLFGTAPMHTGSKFWGTMDGGAIDVHGIRGQAKSWTLLGDHAQAGDTQITLAKADMGWQVGDQIALAPTGFDHTQHEQRTIIAINQKTLTLSAPLQYYHHGRTQTYHGRVIDTRGEVGMLTRNIVVRGDEHSVALRFGAHGMFMGTGRVRISGVEFVHCGQTGLRGRYPAHWHFAVDHQGSYIRRCAVHHSFHRGINIHQTHGVLVEENVAYDVMSHVYIPSEDGFERNNRFLGNLAMTMRTLAPADWAFGPEGRSGQAGEGNNEERPGMFWLRDPGNEIVGNRVAGADNGNGYFYDKPKHGLPPLGGTTIFRDNVAHSIGFNAGLAEFRYPPAARGSGLFLEETGPGSPEFVNFTAWACANNGIWTERRDHRVRTAFLLDNFSDVVTSPSGDFKDLVLVRRSANPVGDPDSPDAPIFGFTMGNRGAPEVTLDGAWFSGYQEHPAIGVVGEPVLSTTTVRDLGFHTVNFRIRFDLNMFGDPITGGHLIDADGSLTDHAPGSAVSGAQQPDWESTYRHDLRGWVAGPHQGRLLVHLPFLHQAGAWTQDASGHGRHGRLIGGPQPVAGRYAGPGLRTSGTGQRVEWETPIELPGDFTIATQIRLDPVPARSRRHWIGTYWFEQPWWAPDQLGGLFYWPGPGGIGGGVGTEPLFFAGTWAHITLIRKQGIVQNYFDGVAQDPVEDDARLVTIASFGGRAGLPEYDLAADWSDLRIYNRALSQGELTALAAGLAPTLQRRIRLQVNRPNGQPQLLLRGLLNGTDQVEPDALGQLHFTLDGSKNAVIGLELSPHINQ